MTAPKRPTDLERAEAALAAGDVDTAAQAFAEILQQDAENAQAAAGLAKCYIKTGDLARAEQTLALVPPAKADSAPVASARAALEIARKTARRPATSSRSRAKLAANPNDLPDALRSRAGAECERRSPGRARRAAGHRRARTAPATTTRRASSSCNSSMPGAPGDPATIAGRQRLSSLLFA